ncbi:MAG: transposase, partial [Candidatus Binatia bacterium]
AEEELEAIVSGWLRQAEASDLREDEEHGRDLSGEELPDWVRDKQRRLKKIREARARLETQAQAQAKEKGEEKDSGGPGRPRKREPGTPKDSAQSNFTDPESRIMKGRDGFIQGYNAQAAVDADSQVIVAQGLTNNASDQQQLAPMAAQIKENTRRQARELSADAGYCSEDNLKELKRRHIEGYIATGRQKHGEAEAAGERKVKLGTRAYAMWQRLRRGGRRSRYRLRKQTVEPVFGQIKQGRGFRQFLLRGLRKVSVEWALICTAHNLLKLAAAWS